MNQGVSQQPNDEYVGPSESTKRLMLSPNDELIETIQKDIDYVNWWDETAGERGFTTGEIKEFVAAQNRLKKSVPFLLSSHRALLEEREVLQNSYDDAEMRASDAIAERNDVQKELQQTREELRILHIYHGREKEYRKEAETELEQVKAERDKLSEEKSFWLKAYTEKIMKET